LTSADGLAGRNVLVTGARGFIGANLRHALNAVGAHITATSRSPYEEPGATWRVADLSTPEAAMQLVDEARADVVFHLSGYVTTARAVENVLPATQANFLDALNLMIAANARPGCRLVLANSLEEPSDQEAGAAPSSPYAAAKYASTSYARMFHALYGTPIAIARISMGYGPRQSDLKKLVPYLCLSALRGEEPALSSGARTCDWVFADDIISGLIACALSDEAMGQVIDIATNEMASVRQVAELIAELVPGAPPAQFGALQDRNLERLRPADVDFAYQRTGWRASTLLREGLAATVDYYRWAIGQGLA
jgi:UDP-glucose 4-epimerase